MADTEKRGGGQTAEAGSGTAPARRTRGFDQWIRGEGNARARIGAGIVVPEGRAGFRMSPETRVFVIGAGFARQFAGHLRGSGIQVTSLGRPSDVLEARQHQETGMLDHPNPESARQELGWAADGGTCFPRDALHTHGDRWIDPFLAVGARIGPLRSVMTRRQGVAAYFARAFQADLVVVTLDTTEIWFDRKTSLALPGRPSPHVYKADPDRFGLKRLSHDEALTSIKRVCKVLKRKAPAQKIVLAVSPVPMERTYSTDDILIANMVAKSTLHTAATTLAQIFTEIDYFPAYEAAMTSDPSRIWMPDRRTVAPELLDALASEFVRRYGMALTAETQTDGTA